MSSKFTGNCNRLSLSTGISKYRILWSLLIILALLLPLCLTAPHHSEAEGPGDYYQINYNPPVFSTTHVIRSKSFSISVRGNITCTNDLPLSVTSGRFKYHIIAKNLATNQTVTIMSGKTITVKPFPDDSGESAAFNMQITAKFPTRSAYGNYSVIAVLDKAEIMVLRKWIAVTGKLTGTIVLGTVQYSAR